VRISVYVAVFKRASELMGGPETLAAYLDVSPVLVMAWIGGHVEPSEDMFLRAVDLLLEREVAKIVGQRPSART
jgi:hypothetical protein